MQGRSVYGFRFDFFQLEFLCRRAKPDLIDNGFNLTYKNKEVIVFVLRLISRELIIMRKIIQISGALITTSFVSAVFAAGPPLQTRIVASGLDRPLFATAPAGDSRLFVVEQGGAIKISQNGAVLPTPFLDLSGSVDTSGERGLLGMAFDPNFATNRRFYVDYIDKSTLNTVVATYQASASNPNIAASASGQTVLAIAQPPGLNNHKAGWIGFRPGEPNNLYIATGDGGGANDTQNRAQNLNDNL